MTNMRMAQGRDRFSLAFKTRFQIRIGRKMGRQDLDGYISTQPGVARTVHFSHAARAQRRLNLVRPEFRARSERHLCARLYANHSTPAAQRFDRVLDGWSAVSVRPNTRLTAGGKRV